MILAARQKPNLNQFQTRLQVKWQRTVAAALPSLLKRQVGKDFPVIAAVKANYLKKGKCII